MKLIRTCLGTVIILAAFVWVSVIRFTNPDETETRLLLDYSLEYVVIVLMLFVGYILAIRRTKK